MQHRIAMLVLTCLVLLVSVQVRASVVLNWTGAGASLSLADSGYVTRSYGGNPETALPYEPFSYSLSRTNTYALVNLIDTSDPTSATFYLEAQAYGDGKGAWATLYLYTPVVSGADEFTAHVDYEIAGRTYDYARIGYLLYDGETLDFLDDGQKFIEMTNYDEVGSYDYTIDGLDPNKSYVVQLILETKAAGGSFDNRGYSTFYGTVSIEADGPNVSPVPEPNTLALIAGGLGLFVVSHRVSKRIKS